MKKKQKPKLVLAYVLLLKCEIFLAKSQLSRFKQYVMISSKNIERTNIDSKSIVKISKQKNHCNRHKSSQKNPSHCMSSQLFAKKLGQLSKLRLS